MRCPLLVGDNEDVLRFANGEYNRGRAEYRIRIYEAGGRTRRSPAFSFPDDDNISIA
jgi:hypothetical protein